MQKFCGEGGIAPSPDPTLLGAFGARPPVPLPDGLDNRRSGMLTRPVRLEAEAEAKEKFRGRGRGHNVRGRGRTR